MLISAEKRWELAPSDPALVADIAESNGFSRPMARALVNRPEILLADEPTGNLDSRTGEEILRLFRDIRAERPECAIVMITHNAEIAALADRSDTLADGVIRTKEAAE